MKEVTKKHISEWEQSNGESFYDYNEGCVSVKDFLDCAEIHYPQYSNLYKEALNEGVQTLVDLLDIYYENKEAYEASLDIVIMLVNNSELYNQKFWEFLND